MTELSIRNKPMNSVIMNSTKILQITLGIVTSGLIGLTMHAAEPKKGESAAPAANQKQFSTAKEAADSLVQAAESYDVNALKEILVTKCNLQSLCMINVLIFCPSLFLIDCFNYTC